MTPRATIALTRYAESDEMLRETLHAATAQQGVAGEVLLVEQQVDSAIAADEFETPHWKVRILRHAPRGLSHARNIAVDQAEFGMILFLDTDAVAAPTWAARMCAALAEEGVAVAGSRILPRWPDKQPLLARSRVVLDQYSMLDLGEQVREVDRVVGAGFGLNRDRIDPDLRFDERLGRREGKLYGGEESEFCSRTAAAGGRILYVGDAVVNHVVPVERTRMRWILQRLYYAGLGRATLGGQPSPSRPPGWADWLFLPLILPPYTAGWLVGRWRSGGSRGSFVGSPKDGHENA